MNADVGNLIEPIGRPGGFAAAQALHLTPGRYHRLLQVIGRIQRAPGEDSLSSGRAVVLQWLREKKSWNISASEALSDRPIQIEAEDSTRALSIESAPGLWAVRLDDPCTHMAGRQWRVELVLVDSGADELPIFGCTLSVLMPAGNEEPVTRPGVPAVVGMMARTQGLRESGRLLDGSLWEVDRPSEVDDLVRFIESQARTVSVAVVSLPRQAQPFYNPVRLASELAGVAVVVSVSADAAQELTERYGRSLGIFGDAFRLYRIGFNADVDGRFKHPLFISNSWQRRLSSAVAYAKAIAMADTVTNRDEQRDVPSFGVIRRIAADQRINAVLAIREGEDQQAAQIARDIALLREETSSWEAYALEQDQRANAAEAAQRQTQARLYQYTHQIRRLEEDLRVFQSERPVDLSRPLEEIEEWAEENMTGRLVITPRAARAAQASHHLEPELIYGCLSLLGTAYWEMKAKGGSDLLEQCRLREASLGVRISPSGDAASMRRYEGEYNVLWEGKRYNLDMHLAGSDSHDKQRGLRIYFAWDADQELVVVGHLPTHLTNTLT